MHGVCEDHFSHGRVSRTCKCACSHGVHERHFSHGSAPHCHIAVCVSTHVHVHVLVQDMLGVCERHYPHDWVSHRHRCVCVSPRHVCTFDTWRACCLRKPRLPVRPVRVHGSLSPSCVCVSGLARSAVVSSSARLARYHPSARRSRPRPAIAVIVHTPAACEVLLDIVIDPRDEGDEPMEKEMRSIVAFAFKNQCVSASARPPVTVARGHRTQPRTRLAT